MDVEFDDAKDRVNRLKHGISLAAAAAMDLGASVIVVDDRADYSERRYRAFGLVDDRLYALVFTMRGTRLRAISLRKANAREVRSHGGR